MLDQYEYRSSAAPRQLPGMQLLRLRQGDELGASSRGALLDLVSDHQKAEDIAGIEELDIGVVCMALLGLGGRTAAAMDRVAVAAALGRVVVVEIRRSDEPMAYNEYRMRTVLHVRVYIL